uniref:phosphoserine phosphatase n=1 Tax=Alexandrium monilatum TaxID=311494 RepID=A0A7S4RSM4_9DINO
MQRVAEEHDAVVTLRSWDATSRPSGKSLVVFELSRVLCPDDLLDELLKEAGAEPPEPEKGEGIWQRERRKVAQLKGRSTTAEQTLVRRLEFTRGARLVCAALKALGFRLAVLAQTGFRAMSDHVRQQLGIDYVICQHLAAEGGVYTGEYTEASDVRFQKSDLLKLMAAREGIEFRNVILVGEFLKGLKVADARLMLETFGPNVHFNAAKMGDLSLALYLLGFSGSHVITLRRMYEPGSPQCSPGPEPDDPASSSAVVEVDVRERAPGQLAQAFAALARFRPQLHISTLRQCGLQNGGMCMCMELQFREEEADAVLKECLYGCHVSGFRVTLFRGKQELRSPDVGWRQRYFEGRHVITLVQKPQLAGPALKAAFGSLAAERVNIAKIERLSMKELAALQITVNLPGGLDAAKFSSRLVQVTEGHGADLAFQKDDVHRWMRRLIVFDMDSTLVQQEVIDEVAKVAGVEAEAKKITESAMRGEIDFFESLKSRVRLLKGQNAEKLFRRVKEGLVYTPGAKLLCSTLKKLGYKMAVISSGFLPTAQTVQQYLGLDYAFANTLEVDEMTGLLTGCTSGPIVTPQRKRALLATIANVEGCKVQQTIAVGDGANDIPMLNTAGLGVAFCAKPKVRALTDFHINQKDLSTVLFLIGLSEHATERLGVADAAR